MTSPKSRNSRDSSHASSSPIRTRLKKASSASPTHIAAGGKEDGFETFWAVLPDDEARRSRWTKKEIVVFEARLTQINTRKTDVSREAMWGFFSLDIPGRTGQACYDFYLSRGYEDDPAVGSTDEHRVCIDCVRREADLMQLRARVAEYEALTVETNTDETHIAEGRSAIEQRERELDDVRQKLDARVEAEDARILWLDDVSQKEDARVATEDARITKANDALKKREQKFTDVRKEITTLRESLQQQHTKIETSWRALATTRRRARQEGEQLARRERQLQQRLDRVAREDEKERHDINQRRARLQRDRRAVEGADGRVRKDGLILRNKEDNFMVARQIFDAKRHTHRKSHEKLQADLADLEVQREELRRRHHELEDKRHTFDMEQNGLMSDRAKHAANLYFAQRFPTQPETALYAPPPPYGISEAAAVAVSQTGDWQHDNNNTELADDYAPQISKLEIQPAPPVIHLGRESISPTLRHNGSDRNNDDSAWWGAEPSREHARRHGESWRNVD